jgi:hypothetical protein
MDRKFSEEVRHAFPHLNEEFDEFEGFLQHYEDRFRERLQSEPGKDGPPIGHRISLVVLSYLNRARLLAWTIVHCVNGSLVPGLYLAARAHFEITAAVGHLLVHFREAQAGRMPPADFSLLVNRLFLARRFELDKVHPDLREEGKAISVMTLLDSMDRMVPDERLKGKFREAYEWLSEFCHPNEFSRTAGFKFTGKEFLFDRTPSIAERDLSNGLGHASLSQEIFFHVYDECVALLDEVHSVKL